MASAAPAGPRGEPAGHQQQTGEGNYHQTLRFIQQTKSPSRVSSIILDSGGHNFNTWRREIPAALEWLGNHLKA